MLNKAQSFFCEKNLNYKSYTYDSLGSIIEEVVDKIHLREYKMIRTGNNLGNIKNKLFGK